MRESALTATGWCLAKDLASIFKARAQFVLLPRVALVIPVIPRRKYSWQFEGQVRLYTVVAIGGGVKSGRDML
jgi:hypothetical protein